MGYSASIEIFGARDRANLEAERYREMCLRFERALRISEKKRDVTWYIAGDSCLAEADHVEDLLGWLADVARLGLEDGEGIEKATARSEKGEILENHFAIRAVAVQGELNISSIARAPNSRRTNGWNVSSDTSGHTHAELFELLRSFKGIGVRVDIPNIENRLFTNAWPTMSSGIPYYLFRDLAPERSVKIESLNRLIDLALEANVTSRKSSRFYVSGIIRAIKYTKSDSKTMWSTYEHVMRAASIPGIELALLALIGRAFSQPEDTTGPSATRNRSTAQITTESDALSEIKDRLAKLSKLVSFVRNLQERRILPDGLIKREALSRYQRTVASSALKKARA